MITLTARIELLKSGLESGASGVLENGTINLSGNNASAEIGAVVGVKRTVKRPFVFGKSVLGGGDKYYGELDYYMGRQLCDNNGDFSAPYTITVSGQSISAITLAFDDLNGAFPKSIDVDGKTYTDDDATWTIVDIDSDNTHIITIPNWNKPNSMLILSGIYIDVVINIDRRNMQRLERTITDRSSYDLPSFGIISNTGNIDFIDFDGEVRDYAEQQILKSGLTVEISLNNTLYGNGEHIGTFYTNKWTYDNNNRVVSVSLKDDLEEWQEINVEALPYDLKGQNPKPQTAEWLYRWLQDEKRTPKKYNVQSFDELDTETQNVLSNTTIQYPMLESGSLWQQWTKLCELCQLHIYKNNNGITVVKYNYGN